MNKMKWLLILLVMPCMLLAQEKQDSVMRFSLKEAQEYALTNNRSILNANLDIEAAKLKVWETTASGLPQISATLGATYMPTVSSSIEQFSGLSMLGPWMYNVDQQLKASDPDKFGHIPDPGEPKPIDPNDMKWNALLDIKVTQLLFSGSYIVGLQSSKVYQSLSKLNLEKSKQDVQESVSTSYFNLLIARENKQILDSTLKNLNKTLLDMQAMSKQGFIEETDLDQMQITVSNVQSSFDAISRLEDISEKLLKLQLGIDFTQTIQLSDNLNTLIDAFTIEQLLLTDFILDNNVNYQLLNVQVKSQELLLKLKKSEFLPDLAAYYQHEKSFNKNAFNFNPPDIIGVQLSIPIFSSGARLAKVGQAKRELYKAQNSRQQAAQGLLVEYSTNRSLLIDAHNKYLTQKRNTALAEKIYKNSLIKYTNGTISATELTTVQNQFLTTQSNYYMAIQALIESKANMEKMLTRSSIQN